MKINCEKVTRFEVIDENGRAYVRDHRFGPVEVDLSFQDEGRTLKVFVKKRPQAVYENEPMDLVIETCNCARCWEARAKTLVKTEDNWLSLMRTMHLCKTCGNKRCPRGSDHRNACSGSNEPGQPGSDY